MRVSVTPGDSLMYRLGFASACALPCSAPQEISF